MKSLIAMTALLLSVSSFASPSCEVFTKVNGGVGEKIENLERMSMEGKNSVIYQNGIVAVIVVSNSDKSAINYVSIRNMVDYQDIVEVQTEAKSVSLAGSHYLAKCSL